jgi:hypothetical protein
MAEFQQSEPDRAHLVRYLLNLLPDDEAERLDLASIADDEIASHLRMVESDLMDDYVTGALRGATLQQFESHYLSSARRRQNVQLAAKFLTVIAQVPVTEVPGAKVPGAGVPGAGVPGAGVPGAGVLGARVLGLWGVAAAAALVIAAGAAFVAQMEPFGLRPRSAAPAVAPSMIVAEPQAAAPKAAEPERPPVPAPAPARADARPHGFTAIRGLDVAALVLWPQTRSAGPLPTLLLPAGRSSVVLELTLESSGFAQYRAGLKDPSDGGIAWRSGWVTPLTTGTRTIVRIAIPVAKLRSPHYSIELSGNSPDGSSPIVESYAFRVVSRSPSVSRE